MSNGRLVANIAMTVPIAKTNSAAHIALRSPRRSIHRPHSGIDTVEVRR